MIRNSHRAGVLLVLLLWGQLVLGTLAAQASALSESVVRLSPLGAIADQSPAIMAAGIREGLGKSGRVDPFVADTVAVIGSRAFSPQRMKARLSSDLAEDLDTQQLQQVSDWYQSPLGQRIARAESRAAAPQAWDRIARQAGELRARFSGTERQRQFERYDQLSRATQTATATSVAIQLSLAGAMASLQANETEASIRERVLQQRPAIEHQARQQVFLSFLYIYQALTDNEVEQYLEFLASDTGEAFTTSAGDAVQAAIMEPVDAMGGQLARLLGPKS